jgi:hypothetical protein
MGVRVGGANGPRVWMHVHGDVRAECGLGYMLSVINIVSSFSTFYNAYAMQKEVEEQLVGVGTGIYRHHIYRLGER